MTALAVLFAATILAGAPAHHGQPAKHPHPEAEAQHQQKLMEQALHRQLEREEHLARQQQMAVHEQMAAQIQARARARAEGLDQPWVGRPGASGFAGRPYGYAPRSYYGGYHHPGHHHGYRHYRHYQAWPMGGDPELAGLQHLKQTLDAVHPGQSATAGQKLAIEQGLARVVEVARRPSHAALDRLAGHVGNALADRPSGSIDTESLALELRAGVNSPYLINAERVAVLNRLEATLKHGHVPTAAITTVVAALRSVEHQEQARR